tara:strand:+ start:5361 stop:5690 length:330 start_codon:yes stop_codon:yes gene_type:complete
MENRMVDTQKFIKMNGDWYKKYKKLNTYNEETKEVNQKKRADKWALKYKKNLAKYKKYLAKYDKVILDNDDLKRVNNELNIMQTRTLDKVLYLGDENRKLKDKIKKLSK